MKIRVTIMTENDKHRPDLTKESIENSAKFGWNLLLKELLYGYEDESESAYVESCELVEE